jgi:hypothetical protein
VLPPLKHRPGLNRDARPDRGQPTPAPTHG